LSADACPCNQSGERSEAASSHPFHVECAS
jgi:hypothetical protein